MTIKIAHIITRIVGGGGEKNTLDTIRGICGKGYTVHLIHGGQTEDHALERADLPGDVVIIQIPELVREVSPRKDFIALRKIARRIAIEKYDIVHTHLAKAGVLGRVAAKRADCNIVVHGIHGVTFPRTIHPLKRRLFKCIERYCARYTDHFIPVGADVMDQYLSAGIGSGEMYTVVRSAIDIGKYERAMQNGEAERRLIRASMGLNGSDIVVGMVSKLEKRKGYIYYLEAASQVLRSASNIKFVIVGDGQEKDALKNYARELGIENNVVFTGYRSDVEDVISIFDVAVLTSLWEGLPQYLVQACLLSKPVVAFDVDGVREVISDCVNGFVVTVRDATALAAGIVRLVEDKGLRMKMGAESGRLVDRSCTFENMVNKTDAIYRSFLSKENKAAEI